MTPPFRKALEELLNSYSRENVSNTPDYILADYLLTSLASFDKAVQEREDWYGHRHQPGRA